MHALWVWLCFDSCDVISKNIGIMEKCLPAKALAQAENYGISSHIMAFFYSNIPPHQEIAQA